MCLRVNKEIHSEYIKVKHYYNGLTKIPKPLVAKTNIVAIKKLSLDKDDNYHTPFMCKNVTFNNGIVTLESDVKEGFRVEKSAWYDTYDVANGIHSFIERDRCMWSREKLFVSIIPKGSKYYLGEDGDLVSEKLIVFETQEDFDKFIRHKGMVTAQWVINNYYKRPSLRKSVFIEGLKSLKLKGEKSSYYKLYE